MPTVPQLPVTAARPCGAEAEMTSAAVAPPWIVATDVSGSMSTRRICDRSITRPSWRKALPAQSCPPPRTDKGMLCLRAQRPADFAPPHSKFRGRGHNHHRPIARPYPSSRRAAAEPHLTPIELHWSRSLHILLSRVYSPVPTFDLPINYPKLRPIAVFSSGEAIQNPYLAAVFESSC